ncbi:hypothetical protein B4U37_07000 [Sutcliffiella horikoshii]|uniref:Uncharacterized protein n=1 Tax=Sutcliffiella horikoshii TaxID=79883 RepID=A0ABM6KHI6_9BACI|nr:hypothetical protein B4U37_07000 [Sutcliffiella horikoshii]
MLIEVEGAQTPAGGRDRGDPAGEPRRLPYCPQASEALGTEINRITDFLIPIFSKNPQIKVSLKTQKAARSIIHFLRLI